MEIQSSVGEEDQLASLSFQAVTVAVCGNRNSKFALKWALDKFVPEGKIVFKLLHIQQRITSVPTPTVGNSIPISKVREDVAAAYKKEIEWQTNAMLLPFKQMCIKRQVEADAVLIEADDVAEAISAEITKSSITILVVGASSHNVLTRKLKARDTSSRISDCVPKFCTVYVVTKGRLSSVRPATSDITESNTDGKSDECISISSGTSHSSSSQTASEGTSTNSSIEYSHRRSSSLAMQRYQALLTVNQALVNRKPSAIDIHQCRGLSYPTEEDVVTSTSIYSEMPYGESSTSSFRSVQTDNYSLVSDQASSSNNLDNYSLVSDQASSSNNLADNSPSGSQVDLNFELERLRIELKHIKGMYTMAQNEKMEASWQLDELNKRRMEETARLREVTLREINARELARQEKERNEAAKREVEFMKECAEREAVDREKAETSAARDAEQKQKLERSLMHIDKKYKKFSFEEIDSATSSFSDALKIGMGAYGTVYKCKLNHIMAAVKVLRSVEENRNQQFQQELEILCTIRHPHLLLLLGACPDHGCLVYEYMENGSLEDRLFRKDNTPPIPWFHRYRIAWEVASALAYLHSSKPKPIVHRDLKPSNILLNQNLVSKIGDVGLSTLLPADSSSVSTMYKDTAPVGTFCYIDPEYQRSGLVSPKSDLYAFGIVILQLITAKPPMALAHIAETALEEGNLAGILDTEAGEWPLEETQDLALLGLSCTELRRRDRPDLNSQVLPMLERLKDIAQSAEFSSNAVQAVPPSYFICPILQDVMNDPCVAADGYTYDRSAIEIWFSMNDKSPMTNSTLPHKHLIRNYSLLSAIVEWKTKIR